MLENRTQNGLLHTGTVIHGTLRSQDILPAILDRLAKDLPTHYAQLVALPFSYIPNWAQEDDESEWWNSEECIEKIDEIFDLLNSHGHEHGYYFGVHPGDGSDIGYWPLELLEH